MGVGKSARQAQWIGCGGSAGEKERMLEVTIFSKDGRELKRYELVGTRPLQIGRGTVCDIQVPVMDVSRQHARLEHDDGEWMLKDLESTHGCVVKGERVRAVSVRAGLEVRVGSARIRFSNLADRIGAELNELLDDADPNAKTSDESHVGDPDAETLPRNQAVRISSAFRGRSLVGASGKK